MHIWYSLDKDIGIAYNKCHIAFLLTYIGDPQVLLQSDTIVRALNLIKLKHSEVTHFGRKNPM